MRALLNTIIDHLGISAGKKRKGQDILPSQEESRDIGNIEGRDRQTKEIDPEARCDLVAEKICYPGKFLRFGIGILGE